MLKNLFKKNKTLDKVIASEVDVALRLMFEIAISDGSLDKNELDLIKKQASIISPDHIKISAIIKKIIDETEDSVSLYPTVKKINDSYSKDEKKELLAVLWRLVAVDKRIDPYEENLYFKIAGLIHIERTSANQIKQENL